MVGLGVIRPGQLAMLTGSSHLHLGVTDRVFHGAGMWGVYPDAILPGVHMVRGGAGGGGRAGGDGIKEWQRHGGMEFECCCTDPGMPRLDTPHPLRLPACSPCTTSPCPVCQVEGGQTSTGSVVAWYRRLLGFEEGQGYEELNAAAEAVPPGSEGVLCLDHFQVGGGLFG